MHGSSGVWGWVVSGYLCPWVHKAQVCIWISSRLVFQHSSKSLHPGQGWHVLLNVSVWLPGVTGSSQHRVYSLRGEVLKPATELAMKKSAICLRASRPVGLFPFRCCSWIRLSSSSLKAWGKGGGESERADKEKITWHRDDMVSKTTNRPPGFSKMPKQQFCQHQEVQYIVHFMMFKECSSAWKPSTSVCHTWRTSLWELGIKKVVHWALERASTSLNSHVKGWEMMVREIRVGGRWGQRIRGDKWTTGV